MIFKLIFCVVLIFASATAIADGAEKQLTEEQCKIIVEKTVKSLNEQSSRYGEEIKLDDLTDKNILDIQSSKGSCDAMREINLRNASTK